MRTRPQEHLGEAESSREDGKRKGPEAGACVLGFAAGADGGCGVARVLWTTVRALLFPGV